LFEKIRADLGLVELAARGNVAALGGAFVPSPSAPAEASPPGSAPNAPNGLGSASRSAVRGDAAFMLHLMQHVSPAAFEYCDEALRGDRAMVGGRKAAGKIGL
jgi:hypothetical protein